MGLFKKLAALTSRLFFPQSRLGREARLERSWQQARQLYAAGRYSESDGSFEESVRIAEEYGEASPQLADHLEKVGDFFHSIGKYTEAESLLKRALDIREESLGQEAPETIRSLNDLALLHYVQGRYEEGEVIYQRLLPILESTRGAEDREVAICLENFAAVLRKQQRSEEAASLQSRAREIRKKLSGG